MRSAGAPTLSRRSAGREFRPGASTRDEAVAAARSSRETSRRPPKAGLEADRAGRRLGERQSLGLDVLRVVIGDDHVEQDERAEPHNDRLQLRRGGT